MPFVVQFVEKNASQRADRLLPRPLEPIYVRGEESRGGKVTQPRVIYDSDAMDAHFHCIPPNRVDVVEADGSRGALPVVWEGDTYTWGYHGGGPNATSGAMLAYAVPTAKRDSALAIALTADVIAKFERESEARIAVREVVAWYKDRHAGVTYEAGETPRIVTGSEMAEGAIQEMEELLPNRGKVGWLEMYRTIHGEPNFAS